MVECCKCKESIGSNDSIKCDGVCGNIYHITCVGPGKGISKTFYNSYMENDNFLFMCASCRGLSLKNVRDSMEKMLNMLIINDERLKRQNDEIVKLNESNNTIIKVLDEVKVTLKSNGNEIMSELHKNTSLSGNKLKVSFADKLKNMVK